jgi:hypothetical protein
MNSRWLEPGSGFLSKVLAAAAAHAISLGDTAIP